MPATWVNLSRHVIHRLLRSLQTASGTVSVDETGNLDQMQLPARILNRCVNADIPRIRAEAGVRVDAPFAGVLFRQMKPAQIDSSPRLDVVEVWSLQPFRTLWISIVQNPFIAGQIADVTGPVEYAVSHFLDDA